VRCSVVIGGEPLFAGRPEASVATGVTRIVTLMEGAVESAGGTTGAGWWYRQRPDERPAGIGPNARLIAGAPR
jgi:hypothetical protein